eukprot:51659_1
MLTNETRQSALFKLSSSVSFTAMITNVFALIIMIIHFNYHSTNISFKLKLFSISILTLGIFIGFIFAFLTTNNSLFSAMYNNIIHAVNENGCRWSLISAQLISNLILYFLNALFLSFYYYSFHSLSKYKYNVLLIVMSILIFLPLIVIDSLDAFNASPH